MTTVAEHRRLPVEEITVPYNPIERWEWEGGAVVVDSGRSEDVGLDEAPAPGDDRSDTVAHPQPEQRRPDPRGAPDVPDRRIALA